MALTLREHWQLLKGGFSCCQTPGIFIVHFFLFHMVAHEVFGSE